MSGTRTSPELVEDPGPPASPANEDRAREERGHESLELGSAYNDADDTDADVVSAPRVVLITPLNQRAQTAGRFGRL